MITSANIIEEWCARVANISGAQLPAWERVLNSDQVRCMDTAMAAVREVAAEMERGQHRSAPKLTHFEGAYRSLLAKFERERNEVGGEIEGCPGCSSSGVVAVVMAWSIKDKRYKPVPRDRVVRCDGKAYRCYVPCTCPKGQVINTTYSRDILRRLHYYCVFERNAHADAHMLACIAKQ